MSHKESKTQFVKRMKSIVVPPGFTAEFTTEDWGWYKAEPMEVFVLTKPDDSELRFDQNGCGHTKFKRGTGWMSFDRTGVEDSFYHHAMWKEDKHNYDVNQIVAEQLERIAKRRVYYETAVGIPGIPFTVAPEAVESLKQRLKKVGQISFTPSGFGTGYVISKRRSSYAQPASQEMATFFGVSKLWVSTLDCD